MKSGPEWMLNGDRSRIEHGTIEGTLIYVGTYYKNPAIRIIERKTGRAVWCLITEEEKEKIAQQATFKDVWEHRRVLARGRIVYGVDGRIVTVHASNVKPFRPRDVSLSEISDPEFTRGSPSLDYLEKLREGDLG